MDTRQHILVVSLQLFLQKSFKEVTLKDIVEKTGLSKGAFYHYFESKEKLFEQVIEFSFSEFLMQDFSKLPHTSLKDFYTAYISDLESKSVINEREPEEKNTFNSNHFYLIFDALKIIPGFREKHILHQQKEIDSWSRIVSMAQSQGEISDLLSPDDVAKTFVYMTDGFGMHLIVRNALDKIGLLRDLYDSYYKLIKK
jgi:TetR/AcrR family transcriptional regulator, transcriptional repressor for nem operon